MKKFRGFEFVLPWLIGTVVFFIIPLFTSLYYSFCNVRIDSEKTTYEFVGLQNYRYIFYTDEYYTDYLIDTLSETLWKTPLIIIFSLFVAVFLNQKFKGRTLARAVFFLPVIIASGPVYNIISGNIQNTSNEQFSTMFSTDLIGELMRFLGLYNISENTEKMILTISDNIFSIVWNSGIQILIFLSALQNIPQSARDSALIEGADGWDFFWRVTLPYVSPLFKVNLVFTVIDTFTSPSNPIMNRILLMQSEWNYGYASAMAWLYFGIVLLFIFFALALVRRISDGDSYA